MTVPIGSLPVKTRFITALTEREGIIGRHKARAFGADNAQSEQPGTAVRLDRCGDEWGESKILHPGVLVKPLGSWKRPGELKRRR